MPSRKKTSTKAASKRAAPTKSAEKTAKRSGRRAPERLSYEEKLTKLKPGDDLNELVQDILTAWSRVKRQVRVADVSPAKLSSLLAKAGRASRREAELVAAQQAKLAPISDARLVANDAVYRAALKVKRVADAVGATDTNVSDAFASVTERFRRLPAPKDEPARG
jgi:serine/threonine protein kinase HipA of HipAB toxin-antitoxin module